MPSWYDSMRDTTWLTEGQGQACRHLSMTHLADAFYMLRAASSGGQQEHNSMLALCCFSLSHEALWQAGVEHFIFSALEDSRPHIQDDSAFPAVCTFQGHPSKLPHRDAKGAIKVCAKCQSLRLTTTN